MHSSPSSSFFWSLGHRILRAQDSLQRLGPSERCNRGTFFTDHMLYRQDPQIRDKVSRKTGTTVQGCGVPVGVAIGGFSERGTPRGFHHRLPGDPATKEAVNCAESLTRNTEASLCMRTYIYAYMSLQPYYMQTRRSRHLRTQTCPHDPNPSPWTFPVPRGALSQNSQVCLSTSFDSSGISMHFTSCDIHHN